MIKVIVTDAGFRTQEGVSKTTGKPYALHIQNVYAHVLDKDGRPQPFPQRVEILLDKDQSGKPQPYEVGEYVLSPSSLYVDRRGGLQIAPRLTPVKVPAKS